MKAARAVCDGLILERSVMGRLRWVAGSGRLDHQTRQRLDDELLLLVVQFLPQARLGNRDVDEIQIQLRHDSPAVEQMAPRLRRVAKEHLPDTGVEASPPASRSGAYPESAMNRRRRNLSSLPGPTTWFRPAESE